MKRTLGQIAEMLEIELPNPAFSDVVVEGASINTRTLKKGNLFIPFKGEKVDGHQYVPQAVENGASAVFWQEGAASPPENVPHLIVKDPELALQRLAYVYRRQAAFKVVAITGSNGKTTTKDMVAGVLSAAFSVQKTEGNFNNQLGLPLTLLNVKDDTEISILEMGMSGFRQIAFLTELAAPDIAVITNIGESHLQDLGSREGIAQAKFEITEGLAEEGILFYYGDEPLLQSLVEKASGFKTGSYGYSETNGLYPKNIEMSEKGSRIFLTADTDHYIDVPVLGKHNVLNALAAIRVALHLGMDEKTIAGGFASMELTSMRMERVEGAKGETIINDAYNASPTSMKAAIEFAEELKTEGRKILLLGDMLELGEDEEAFHREIGRGLLPEKIDYVLTFGERAQWIADEAAERFPKGRVRSFGLDKPELISILSGLTAKGDLIVVKGSRGMQLEEVVQAMN
ncbi:UDP-N-acetylmuramoyl-tripeptide--D-alanyl-D-alanine ligase [Jeotgalibacillus proteolyticus]|uniref:UDP-N-acetylmuramoyl-tripeptide--D-alanyl-D-alanine ligase n=1 Tax=Jeotgalibacillus proteolyticus TaxID=2082395 RepID=A0A2S5GBZ2_9BACL|nr:UDP-N-acetylmuramoyl-tripeptide--D-alanyl-D-alanine ligase [Jeotgalibacillus proteolyticus]PPA70557.1 UDP-N-acetylmuramoyl-tripeptide--D-alanyl-D-alanine ligase [Jeotgalibacillus proteolyticus]